nr:phosphoglucosamine mutase-like [Parasteatoda tepidariorum]
MFPDSDIAKNYNCGRTKSSAIANEMANELQKSIMDQLKNAAFSIAIDGTNDSDSKLHPLVVTFFDELIQKIQSCVLAFTIIRDGCTGVNIANGVLDKLRTLGIPFQKCVSFGAGNAPVMMDVRNNAQKFLKDVQNELIIIGCPCHLLNLAFQKSISAMNFPLDQVVIDIFLLSGI